MSVIAFLIATGGYGGYKVVKVDNASEDSFENLPHKVLRVVDGDTFDIEGGYRVRLLGIDSPEKNDCYFDQSKLFLEDLIEGKEVYLEKDITASDRFGRLLRYAILKFDDPQKDNILVNNQMVLKGFAFDENMTADKKYRDLLASSERKAREEKLGMWLECGYLEKEEKEKVLSLREKDTGPEDPSCTIKGNISEKGYGMNYFIEGCPNYNRIKIDSRKGEKYFCSEEEAKEAGFTKSVSCQNAF